MAIWPCPIALTTVTSLITPFTLPLLLSWQYGWLGLEAQSFQIPVLTTTMQLIAVTLLPVTLGMWLRHRFHTAIETHNPWVQRITGQLFIALVVALIWMNHTELPALFSSTSAAVLGLCLLAMGSAKVIARRYKLPPAQQATLTVEVGIQNAGTAMMVGASLLQQPSLAMIALYYGVAMNLPALLLIIWYRINGATADAQTDSREFG